MLLNIPASLSGASSYFSVKRRRTLVGERLKVKTDLDCNRFPWWDLTEQFAWSQFDVSAILFFAVSIIQHFQFFVHVFIFSILLIICYFSLVLSS